MKTNDPLLKMVKKATLDQFHQNFSKMINTSSAMWLIELSEAAGSDRSWLGSALNGKEDIRVFSLLRVYAAIKKEMEQKTDGTEAFQKRLKDIQLMDEAVINFAEIYLDLYTGISLDDSLKANPDTWDGLISRWDEQNNSEKLGDHENYLLKMIKTHGEAIIK